jgi:hypothetical protein
MVVVETGCRGVKREDDHKENIGMLIYFNHEISRSNATRNSDMQRNNFSKIEDT